jgi:hypothetical protein
MTEFEASWEMGRTTRNEIPTESGGWRREKRVDLISISFATAKESKSRE